MEKEFTLKIQKVKEDGDRRVSMELDKAKVNMNKLIDESIADKKLIDQLRNMIDFKDKELLRI